MSRRTEASDWLILFINCNITKELTIPFIAYKRVTDFLWRKNDAL
jgi:hypothetical protein